MDNDMDAQIDALIRRVNQEIARNADVLDYIEELSNTSMIETDIPVIEATHISRVKHTLRCERVVRIVGVGRVHEG